MNDPNSHAAKGEWESHDAVAPTLDTDRSLLFGVLAVHNGFIDRGALEAAKTEWETDKSKMLPDVLVKRGELSEDDRAAIDQLLVCHLAKHDNNPQESLSSLSISPTVSLNRPSLSDTASFTPKQKDGEPKYKEFGDYKLIGEIAKGGMGVVYKALQTGLNRLVAVKMIRSGEFADEQQVKRFYTEAEAAAKLDHPGIVPVYEVGERNGQHYYSMAFVDGQSLHDKVKDDGPLPPKEAATVIRIVAESVHFAHGKGVVHRDIKPQNVLLDSECQPRVTDFGLAKQLHGSSDLTGTGQIMGTPSYMAPEQAAGRLDEVGPISDVYSLGTTLYYLLTGRPPFQAASSVETLQQVVSTEPVPVRRLNPAIPRNVETICLKCLRKESGRRYSSARELAEDLDCWLANKPIVARPVGRTEKVWLRCKRRPVVASLIALIAVLIVVGTFVFVEGRHRLQSAALVEQLLSAEIDDVPEIVEELESYRRTANSQLREAFADAQQTGEAKKQLHASLGLLPTDKSQAEYLYDRMLKAEPDELLVIRQMLFVQKDGLVDRLWTAVERPDEHRRGERLRAAAALASFEPDSTKWKTTTRDVAKQLVAVSPSSLAQWKEAFRPVRRALLAPLSDIFQDRNRTETERSLATDILIDYAADELGMLADLVMNADEHQFALVFPKLEHFGDRAVSVLESELEEVAKPRWKDDTLDSRWVKPESSVVQRIEKSHGLLDERFAFCQTMPIDQFVKTADQLRKSGYRPIRLRPYVVNKTIRVAAIWTRDAHDWRLLYGLSVAECRQANDELQKQGYQPVDVSGYIVEEDSRPKESYAALWILNAAKEPTNQVQIGIGYQEHLEKAQQLQESGYRPSSLCVHVLPSTEEKRLSTVWKESRTTNQPSFRLFGGVGSDYSADVFLGDLLVDVRIDAGRVPTNQRDVRYIAIWHTDTEFDSAETHGGNPDEHLKRSSELGAQDFRPISISVAESKPSELITASVWHRPQVPVSAKEALAQRQTNAAVALLRLGRAKKVWPLLKHSPDPRVRSYLIHWCASREVDPKLMLDRLAVEEDVSAKRALILCLGEFGNDKLGPAMREQLIPDLLKRYRDDPDAGIHGATEWLLRHWGQSHKLVEIDHRLATGKAEGNRSWYMNGESQAMVIIRGPVEFVMGSPTDEPHRDHDEPLHKVRINRSFAVASKEVTVAEFERFWQENPKLRRQFPKNYSPSPDCPQNSVSWYQAAAYCNWLSKKEGISEEQWCYIPNELEEYAKGMKLAPNYLTRTGYRMPTEAEWEFACRAGTKTSRHYGQTDDLLNLYASYQDNSENRTWPVGTGRPNELGLFNTLGNVREWCQERALAYLIRPDGLPTIDVEDVQTVVTDEEERVLRGLYFSNQALKVRSANRNSTFPQRGYSPDGFRLARTMHDG